MAILLPDATSHTMTRSRSEGLERHPVPIRTEHWISLRAEIRLEDLHLAGRDVDERGAPSQPGLR